MNYRFLFLVLIVFLITSCNEIQSPTEDINDELIPTDNAKEPNRSTLINADSIRNAELGKSLVRRFKCYVVRQSLLDVGKIDKDSCHCKSARNEEIVFNTAIDQDFPATIRLMNAVDNLDINKVHSDTKDRDGFIFYWTNTIFKNQPLDTFKSTRSDTIPNNPKKKKQTRFEAFSTTLEEGMIADYPLLENKANENTEKIIKKISTERIADPEIITTDPIPGQTIPWQLMLNIFFFAALLFLLIFILLLRRRVLENDRWESSIQNLQAQVARLHNTTNTIEERIKEFKVLRAENSSQAKNTKQEPEPNINFQPAFHVQSEIKKTVPDVLKTLFFSSPNSDGSFNHSSGRMEIVPGASIYKFELQNETTASVSVIDSLDAIHLALGTPENALKPVCEYFKIPIRVEHIITDDQGAARLEGSTWKIKRKAKISFH